MRRETILRRAIRADASSYSSATKGWAGQDNAHARGSLSVARRRSGSQKKGCEYKFYTEFQSHEPEFDYLKSLEIEEKINKIRWCKRQNAAHFLLSTNGTYFWAFDERS